jgi:signal transduction histidine kinase
MLIRGLLNGLRMRMRKLTYDDEYRDAMMRLEQRSELEELGSIVGSIVHEISTPLASMGTIIHQTQLRFKSNSEIQKAMDKLEYERKRIGEALRTVTYLRGDAEYFERAMEKVSVLEVIHHSIKSLKATADISAIHLKVNGRDIFIKAYRPMLERAFINILKNAVESIRNAERQHGLIVVTVRPDPQTRRQVRVEIADNGHGFFPEKFSEGRALPNTGKQLQKIKGVGLFMVKRIIDIHRGDLSIASAQGGGAKVFLTFPTWEVSLSEQDH